MGKGAKKGRHDRACPSCGAPPEVQDPRPAGRHAGKGSRKDTGNDAGKDAGKEKAPAVPTHLAAYAHAASLTGAKKIKKECCRSSPRCKGCPVMLMRAARLQEAGVRGKHLKKALKKARAA